MADACWIRWATRQPRVTSCVKIAAERSTARTIVGTVIRYAVTNHFPLAPISPAPFAMSAEYSPSKVKPQAAYRVIDAAIFSATIMMGALMLADGTFGRIEPSTIRRLLT